MVGNFAHLLLARFGVGVGEAVVPAVNSVLSDYFPRAKRASALSVYMLAVPIGAFAGAALGGLLAQHWGWRTAFVVAGTPGLLLAVLLRLTVKEPVRGQYDDPAITAKSAPPLSAVLKRMVARKAQMHVIAGSAIASAAGYGINFFLAPYFNRRFGLDFTHAGFLAGLIGAVPGVLSILAGGLVTDLGARRDVRFYAWIPGWGLLLAFPFYVLSLLQGEWPLASVVLMVTGLLQYAYLPATAAVTQNMMQPRMRASAAAICGLIVNLIGLGLGPLLVGALSDVLAESIYGDGEFAAACHGAAAAKNACAQASAVGLQWAMIAASTLYVWAAVHYFLAARTLKRDLD
jgi:MFS family permease